MPREQSRCFWRTQERDHRVGAQHPELAKLFDEPIISINPGASEKQVFEALKPPLAGWKQRRNHFERRDRSDKCDLYFEVWDLREGWTGSGYDRARELPLKKIAQTLKRPISTVGDQYLRAFELVTGHGYRRELWFQLFGPIKIHDLVLRADIAKANIRPLKSPSRSVIGVGSLTTEAVRGRELHAVDLRLDVDSFIRAGASDAEILKALELPETASEFVAYVRRRGDIPDKRTAE